MAYFEEFKGMLVVALLPGLLVGGYIVLAIAESARAGRPGGRRKKKKGKNDDE